MHDDTIMSLVTAMPSIIRKTVYNTDGMGKCEW
jgi:hypothetical protein